MNLRLTSEQITAVRQQAQEAQNQADLAIMNNRRRIKELENELAAERAKSTGLTATFNTARDLYNKTLNVGVGSDIMLDFGQLGYGQKLDISTLLDKAYSDKDYTYFVRSRSGGRPHQVAWKDGWTCKCESGAIRGWCWVTKALDKGIRVGRKGEQFIVDEKGHSHVTTRTLNSVL